MMDKTLPKECVFVIVSEIVIVEAFNKSGLYFHPPTTMINSKKIIKLTTKPTGI